MSKGNRAEVATNDFTSKHPTRFPQLTNGLFDDARRDAKMQFASFSDVLRDFLFEHPLVKIVLITVLSVALLAAVRRTLRW